MSNDRLAGARCHLRQALRAERLWVIVGLLMGLIANGTWGVPPAQAAPTAAIPTVTLNVPGSVFIGEAFSFTVTFDNTAATDVGYGPYIDLIFPVTGADGAGAAVDDGIDFVNATYLGQPVTTTQLTFPTGTGCVLHPYAVDNTGNPIQVCGTPGDKLVVLQLPFGSFTADQPPAAVTVNATLSNLADLGTPLTITARGGFRYGNDPLDNPITDPSIIGATTNATVTPKLIDITKTYNGPEDETATGPNFPRSWTITVDIAAGQTVTNLDVTDLLPNNVAYLGVTGINPTGSIIAQPPVGVPSNPPNNQVIVRFASVTGGTGANDATYTVQFFVPQFDANAAPVINPTTGDDVISTNQAQALGDWTPLDTRDPGGTDNAAAGPAQHILTDKSIAIQKSVAVVNDIGAPGAGPGDTLEYTLNVQISDFFAFQSLVISDTFSDGQRWDTTFVPTLSVTEHGSTSSGPMAAANYTVTLDSPGTGTTTVLFAVSDELIDRGLDGRVLGGCVPAGGTGGPAPDCGVFNGGPTTAVLRFRTVIQETFSDTYPSGDPSVDQGDVLDNAVTVTGDLLAVSNLAPNGQAEADTSGAGVSIVTGQLVKTVYAVNGVACSPQPCSDVWITADDTLTYRLRFAMPSGDIENLRLTDYLPLPVFLATEVTPPFSATVSATPPPAGTAKFGPDDTFFALSGIVPTITTNAVANSIRFDYGSYDSADNSPRTIDILFTVTASNDPFADGLFLTNQVRVQHGSTNAGELIADAIVQIGLTEPKLDLRKGVVAVYNENETPNTNGVFTPGGVLPSGVTVNPPGTCARIAGTVHSGNLGTTFNSNLSNTDAGDRVTYAVVIENIGSGVHGAYNVTVKDTLPAGITLAQVSNLCVQNGAGTVLAYTGTLSDFFGAAGIELVDPTNASPPPATLGALGPGLDANGVITDGTNIAIITYDVVLPTGVAPLQNLDNTATLTRYTASEGGANIATAGPAFNGDLSDEARTTVAAPDIAKAITGTNQAHTSGTAVAIGEIITYTVTITVPEGTSSSVTLVDTLDTGLAYVRCAGITASPALITSIGSFATACNDPVNPTVTDSGRIIAHGLGTVTNTDTNNATAETITVVYEVVVLNTTANVRGVTLNNSAVWSWAQGSRTAAAPNVTIVEPTLQVSKTATPTVVDSGDVITFTLTVQHTAASNADAFDLVLTDIIPTGLTYVPASLQHVSGVAPTTMNEAGGTVTVGWNSLPLGQSSTVRFRVTVNAGTPLGQSFTNTADLRWTSLPGPKTTPQSAYNGVSTERTGNTTDPGGSANTYAASGQAVVTFNTIQLTKSIVATSEAHTGPVSGVERVAIGEIVRYRLVVRFPEASVTNLQLRDRLPTGLRFLNDGTAKVAFVANQTGISSTTITPLLPGCSGLNITGNSGNVTPTCPLPDPAVSRSPTTNDDAYGSGDDPYFKLGDVTNNDSDADDEFIVVEFNALVENITGNQAFNNATGAASATTRSNDFQFLADGATVATSGSVSVRIAEPVIRNLSKTVLTAPGDAGDTLVYRLTYGNTASGADAAAAFDIVITDVLNTNLVFQSITGSTTGGSCGSTPSTFSGGAVGQTVTATVTCLNPGGTVTIDITAQVIGTAVAGTTIPNTANLVYTGLPGSGTAGNPTGSTTPGPDGSATGERTGADGSGGLNDYVSTSSVSTTLNTPTLSKLAPSPLQYTIGETITYNLRVTLPEGITQNLRLTDVLPTGLGYVSHQVITTAAASGGLLPADYNGVLPPPTCTGCTVGASGTLTFTFGNVQTNGSGPGNGTSNNQFLLRVVALVLNITGNQQGVTRQNTADLVYDDPTLGANRTVAGGSQTITIIEPQITTTKTVTPTTGVEAGDILTYAFTLTNTGNSPAYDVTVVDNLAQGVGFTALVACVLQPGNVLLPSLATPLGNTVTFDGIPAGSWDIPIGGSITCTYTALALGTLFVNGPHTNTVDADWSSLDGVAADERVYDDTPGITVDGSQDSATATFTVDAPTFAKSDGGRTQATIGDTVFYTLTITSPLGVIRNLTVQDVLPAGLIYNGDQAVNGISTVPVFTASAPNDGSAPVTLTWNFGNATVVVSPVTITFSATVANVSGNQQGQTRTNTASLSHHNALGVPQTALTAADAFLLVEPVLSITKSIVPPLPVDAGDPITYTIAVTHAATSGADAFDVVVLDPIPAHLVNPTVVSVTATGIPAPSAEITGGSLRVPALADGTFDLPLGAGITVTLRADLAQTVMPNQIIVNTAAVTWSSQDGTPPQERTSGNGLLGGGGLNDYELQGSVGLTSGGYTIAKSVQSTSAAHTTDPDVTIGEVVTYALLITLPEGTMPSLQVIDFVPAGMAYVGGSVAVDTTGFGGSVPTPTVTPAGNGADGQDVQIDFGTITVTADNNPANNSFTITLATRVLDVPGNSGLPANQTSLPNAATLQVGTGSVVSSNTVILDVVEPLMTVTKTITPAQAAANEVITITLFVQNAGLADAFDVVLSDALPTGLSFYGGLTHVSGLAPSSLNAVGNTVTATWTAFPDGAGSTIRFQAQLAGNVTNGQVIVNQAVVTQATTLPGNVTGERQEPPSTGTDDVTVVAPDVTLNKDDGQTTAYAGEVLIYTLLVGNAGQALAPHVVITETVPAYTTFNAGASSSGWSCSDGAPAGTVCTYAVGNLPAGSSTTVDFAVTVVDPLATSVTAITNQATAADDGSRGADPNPNNNGDGDTNTVLVGRIGDRVWHDLNGNGLQDAGEPGLANVTVRLYRSGDPAPLLTTTTDGSGFYSFANLAPGNYVVEFVPPSGYAFTYPDVGSNDAVDSDANPADGRTGVITLGAGGTITSVDAGLYLPVSIGDFVFFDGNGNGIQDGSETVGLSGIVITATNLGTGQVYTTTSGPVGDYLFPALPPGTYQVSAPPSAPGVLRTTPSPQLVTLSSGGVYLNADFGYIAPTAVALVGFTAERQDGIVWVRWETWNEHDLEGFIVLRSETLTGPRVPVSSLIPAANRSEGATYAWPDPNAGAGTVWYWLEVRPNGQMFGPIPALAEAWGRVFFPRLRR